MTLDKSCPGSRTIREPRPENITCPNCGTEVEIWTDELKAGCPHCGNKVLRAQQASCIDWCPHARECVGPEVYERLRPQAAADLAGAGSPLDILEREHVRALESLALLRAASLCLKLGALKPESPVRGKGIDHLGKVLDYLDKEIRLHFQREEELLFPLLEKHFGMGKSPTQILRGEHGEFWHWYGELKKNLAELQKEGSDPSEAIVSEVQHNSLAIEHLLQEHIRRENESLLPLSKKLLGEAEIAEISDKWHSVKLESIV
ncbi:MAG: Hemerythrin protein [Dehalococcoidales bacterium]|nr:Hemerythrin protein [Dehalococcoidales bacterium]